ncbi:AAA domain protein [uncultured archaeon]|nr:AAA domain protein [uncultured archaeon]
MDVRALESVVLDQTSVIKKLDLGYPREELPRAEELLKAKANIVVTGHRRAGKSTFLLQLMNKHFKGSFYYLNFGDERLIDFDVADFQILHELLLRHFGEKKVFLFDEIQGKKGWDRFVARMYETGNRFFITGSNAFLLSREISTYLTGRHLDIEMYPFSFREFLGYNNFNENPLTTKGKVALLKLFDEYVQNGGFPEVVTSKNTEILQSIYDDVINKDILGRYQVEDANTIKKIALFLLSSFAKEVSYTSIKNSFGLGSTNTAKKYVSYLTNTFMMFEVPKFSYSAKEQTYLKKIYCIDTGMINKMAFTPSENKGRLLENLVFIELKRRKKQVFYWKSLAGKEVDFILVDKGKPVEAIQVCYDLNKENLERELGALKEAAQELKIKKTTMLTYDQRKTEGGTDLLPVWEWLIGKE